METVAAKTDSGLGLAFSYYNSNISTGRMFMTDTVRNHETWAKRTANMVTAGMFMASLLVVAPAQAIPMLELSSGGSTVTVNGSSSGSVVYVGSIGNFSLNVAGGASYPLLGSAFAPHLDLASLNISSVTGGTLTIKLTDTGFINSNPGGFNLASAIGGGTSGTIKFATYFDQGNTPFATTHLIADLGTLSSYSFAGGSNNQINPSGPYSLTLMGTIDHPAGGGYGQASSFNATLKVPEPATAFLLLGGLLICGVIVRRYQSGELAKA